MSYTVNGLEVYNISFSGGRTSAYMTHRILTEWKGRYHFIVTFANTGLEHEKTLKFVRNCDEQFGFGTVWIEGVVNKGRVANSHRIVDFATASRRGEPFEASIAKYGIPNMAFPWCTRDLKLTPIRSYIKSLGMNEAKIRTAVGIRADETRRVNRDAASKRMLEYPLIDVWPIDKEGILAWWEDQPFDLGIEEFQGNCQGCWKKSLRKQFLQIDKDPSVFDFHRRMEKTHRLTGPQVGERVFFRNKMDTEELFRQHAAARGNYRPANESDSGGCGESCELFPTTENHVGGA